MTEYENQAWLTNWLRLKAKQEEKDFNNLAEVKAKVVSICFIQLELKGKVVIEDFPHLKQLNLSNNKISEITIKNCPDLKLVSLAHNKLTKLTIENCLSVKEIYTHNNQLEKWDVPVEEMKKQNLRIVSYSNNPLSPTEKARLDTLGLPDRVIISRVDSDAQTWLDAKYPLVERDKVEKLDLGELGLSGELNLAGFTNLKRLDVSDNELTKLELDYCPNLEYLDCSNNYRIGETEIKETVKIEGVWTERKRKKKIKVGISSLDLSKNKQLQEVHANHCFIEKINLTGLTKLHTLMLTSNKFDELDLSSLVELKELNCALSQSFKFKKLDLTNNQKLIGLYCYKNSLEELEVNHLKDLQYLYCYDNGLNQIDCNGLKKLEKLSCQGQYQCKGKGGLMGGLNLQGCESLEELDCAENGKIKKVDCSNLKKLKTLSCKVTSELTEINVSNCENLTFLDYSLPSNISVLNLDGANNLKEVYYSKEAKVFPDWRTIPSLEKVGILERKQVKGEDGLEWCAFMEEIDVLGIRNTERIQQILANPSKFSLEYLISIEGRQLHGVSYDLRTKLRDLGIKKFNKRFLFADEGYETGDEKKNLSKPEKQKKEESSPLIPQNNTPTPPSNPKPNKPDYEKLYFELLAKIKSGEITIENKEQIINSNLSEEQKQELLKLLERKIQPSFEIQPKTTNYWPWICGAIAIGGLVSFIWYRKRKRK
ncbi:Putative Internalin-related protein [endosymbiont DhMRE of Dentiscutata heterogama]|uniref:leucine-rich repeat domain-containing protein n=1 Tax=endosymbiont DhMRE of Dentiscutata heterogama TaxID=1609546 RepID=UPI000629D8E6|nr:leucine-rich repeat domain-containing protein [endosymbiont DhMRE of Dentiscutata heterogama]CFW93423.1 Putative Internalin-related protein [endosymbiont DhMRE of Dentiscutata heterogama]